MRDPFMPLTRLAAILLLWLVAGCQPSANAADEDNKVDLSSDIAKASYQIGYGQAARMQQSLPDVVDMAAFLAGVEAFVNNQQPPFDDATAAQAMAAFQAVIQEKQEAARAAQEAQVADARAGGDAFRAEYAQKEGVVALPSGLLYEVITEGAGEKPTAKDTVVTHYHGTLIDGTIFDSSVDRGQPATFGVGQVISGWTEALQLMAVGSKWRLVIPPDLAYGERGAGASIPPSSTLIFEVELLEIK